MSPSLILDYFCAIMKESKINISVQLDDGKVPHDIRWSASDSTAHDIQKAKAMLLAFWDGSEKSAMRIDLWTKDMMMDEMADFYFQVLMTMADTFDRATGKKEMVEDLKKFANQFHHKFTLSEKKETK